MEPIRVEYWQIRRRQRRTFFCTRTLRQLIIVGAFLCILTFVCVGLFAELPSYATETTAAPVYVADMRLAASRHAQKSNQNDNGNENSDDDQPLRIIASKVVDVFDFENFDNVFGGNDFIVPNLVHLIYLGVPNVTFHHLVNIYSIFLNHKPDLILIHCDECSFGGKHWQRLKATVRLWQRVQLRRLPAKPSIFGQPFESIEHKSEVWKLLILMNYGGIVLDSAVYVVASLDRYRKYEMTICFEHSDKNKISNQLLVANKNARFLKTWYDLYRTKYKSEILYYSGGYIAARAYRKSQFIAHYVQKNFAAVNLAYELYKSYWAEWKTFDAIHLYLGSSKGELTAPVRAMNETVVANGNFTYARMARDVLTRINSTSS